MSDIPHEIDVSSLKLSDLERDLDAFFSTHSTKSTEFANVVADLRSRYIQSSHQYDMDIYVGSNQFIQVNKNKTVCNLSSTDHAMTTSVRIYKQKLYAIHQKAIFLMSGFNYL